MAYRTKELVYEILQIKKDLDEDIPEWSDTLELMDALKLIIEIKKLIELENIQLHSFETARNIKRMSRAIDTIKGYIYELKAKNNIPIK